MEMERGCSLLCISVQSLVSNSWVACMSPGHRQEYSKRAWHNKGFERFGLCSFLSLTGPREIVWFVFQILDWVSEQIQPEKCCFDHT